MENVQRCTHTVLSDLFETSSRNGPPHCEHKTENQQRQRQRQKKTLPISAATKLSELSNDQNVHIHIPTRPAVHVICRMCPQPLASCVCVCSCARVFVYASIVNVGEWVWTGDRVCAFHYWLKNYPVRQPHRWLNVQPEMDGEENRMWKWKHWALDCWKSLGYRSLIGRFVFLLAQSDLFQPYRTQSSLIRDEYTCRGDQMNAHCVWWSCHHEIFINIDWKISSMCYVPCARATGTLNTRTLNALTFDFYGEAFLCIRAVAVRGCGTLYVDQLSRR